MSLFDKDIVLSEAQGILWETALFTVVHADFCAWPGYLILHLKGPERSLAQLAPHEAADFGLALGRCAQVLEAATGAERIYLLSFAEVDRQLHVHVLARTPELAQAWRQAAPSSEGPVDGPALFQWVRAAWPAGSHPPARQGLPELSSRLRQLFSV